MNISEKVFNFDMQVIYDGDKLRNGFINTLIDYILPVVEAKVYNDPMGAFDKGLVANTKVLEEIYIELLKPLNYDVNDQSYYLVADPPTVQNVFHRMNVQVEYKQRVGEDTLKFALELRTFPRFIEAIVNNMYNSMKRDRFLLKKYAIAKPIIAGIQPVVAWDSDATPAKQSAVIKSTVDKFTFMKRSYNRAGVDQWTPKENTHIIMTVDFKAERDNQFLATIFNMEKGEFDRRYNVIDSFAFEESELDLLDTLCKNIEGYRRITEAENAVLASIPAVAMDEDWLIFHDIGFEAKYFEELQPANLNRYMWLHMWCMVSTSPFKNCVVFLPGTNELTAIDIGTITYNGTSGAYTVDDTVSYVQDLGYASGAAYSVNIPVAVTSSGTGMFAAFGSVDPNFVKVTLTSTDATVAGYIKSGKLYVIPALETAEFEDRDGDDITAVTKLYTIHIDGSIRQQVEHAAGDEDPTYVAREATLKFEYRGEDESITVKF